MNSMIVFVHIHKYPYNYTYISKQDTAMTLNPKERNKMKTIHQIFFNPLPVQIILIVMC